MTFALIRKNSRLNLGVVHIGKVFFAKIAAKLTATSIVSVFAFVTMGKATQIEWFLFVSCHPRCLRQVRYCFHGKNAQ